MLKLNGMALPLVDVVKSLSDEYGVTKQALYHDWKKRGEWQTEIFDLDDLNSSALTSTRITAKSIAWHQGNT